MSTADVVSRLEMYFPRERAMISGPTYAKLFCLDHGGNINTDIIGSTRKLTEFVSR